MASSGHKKPVGKLGVFTARGREDRAIDGHFAKIDFPAGKADIEKLVAEWFVGSLREDARIRGEEPLVREVRPNEEASLDFSVATPDGPAYLELQEAAPLDGPYVGAPTSYCPYDFAQYVLSKIFEKSEKYSPHGRRAKFLLIYATHFGFSLSDSVIQCLQVWLSQRPPSFRAVFSFTPIAWGRGIVCRLYPISPEALEGVDPEAFRANVCYNLDPANWRVVSGG